MSSPVLSPSEALAAAAALVPSGGSDRTRGLIFRRAAGKMGMSRDSLRASLQGVTRANIDIDDDEQLGRALSALTAAGGQAERWTGQAGRGSPQDPEDWGFYKTTTASGSTGAGVAFSMTLEVAVENLVLHLWDPEALLTEGYLTDLKVDRKELILSPVENQEFIPAVCLNVEEALGHERRYGGIYIGDLDKNQVISGSFFIPTSTQDVTWGWVGRCTLQERVREAVRFGRGRG